MPDTGVQKFSRHTSFAVRADSSLLGEETLDGRKYITAPVVPIVSGVHNMEFVSYDEITVFVDSWDGIPLPVDHPVDSKGLPITANSPDVIESSVIGRLFNVVAREDIQGISGEIWIDIEKAATVPGGAEVLRKLQAGEQLEVSTAYNTYIDNIPGEWMNKKTGKIEKFRATQTSLRPDHLALLPFDTGACSWEDGCGSPRINAENVESGDNTIKLPSTENVTMPIPKEKGTQNGKQIGAVLAAALEAQGQGAAMITRLASAAGIEKDKMKAIAAGEIDFIPRQWIQIFAAILDIDPYDLYAACSSDGSTARYSANEQNSTQKNADAVTIPNNSTEMPETAHNDDKPCKPCEKSLSAKIQEAVTNTLKTLGIVIGSEQEKATMDKKTKVDAIVASNQTKFESQREWLMTLSDDQLAIFEPASAPAVKVEPVQVTETAAPAVVAPVQNAAAVAPAATVAPEITAEMIYKTLGTSAEEFKTLRETVEKSKAVRNAKIAEIAGIQGCAYTKEELTGLSDAMLDKTLAILQPSDTPFRVGGAPRQQSEKASPAPPSILLAKPVQEGK